MILFDAPNIGKNGKVLDLGEEFRTTWKGHLSIISFESFD